MAKTRKRKNPGDVANDFVRCVLSDVSDYFGKFTKMDWFNTAEYFNFKCPYTGDDISNDFASEKCVFDHLIPHNKECVGLNLYGNIIVTTNKTNAAKGAKSFEDFILNCTLGSNEEKYKRIEKIKKFQNDSGYLDIIKKIDIDGIREFCKSEYNFIVERLKNHQLDYSRFKKNE